MDERILRGIFKPLRLRLRVHDCRKTFKDKEREDLGKAQLPLWN